MADTIEFVCGECVAFYAKSKMMEPIPGAGTDVSRKFGTCESCGRGERELSASPFRPKPLPEPVDELDLLANEIEQGFMQQGGWRTCRYLLGKLVKEKQEKIEQLRKELFCVQMELVSNIRAFHLGPAKTIPRRNEASDG